MRLVSFLSLSAQKLDRFTERTGYIISWLVIILTLLIGYDVLMRYLFQRGSISLQELQWHLFATIFLLGAAYTFRHDEHVRIDLIYRSRLLSDKMRAWIDLIGTLFLLLPFCVFMIVSAWPFVMQAYIHNEVSPDPGGLAFRWLIKAMIPAGFALLHIQGIAEICKKIVFILEDKPR